MAAKVINIKTKNQTFKDWLREVIELNKLDENFGDVSSAIFFWESKDEEGKPVAQCARFNINLEELDWYKRCLEGTLEDLRLRNFLRDNIGDFIQYIGD